MYTRWINCENFTPVEKVYDCSGKSHGDSLWTPSEDKTCSDCDNFRANCHNENCPDCKDVPYEFFCAIDKQEI